MACRVAYREDGDRCKLYIDGDCLEGEGSSWRRFVQTLCQHRRIDLDSSPPLAADPAVRQALRNLWQRSKLEAMP